MSSRRLIKFPKGLRFQLTLVYSTLFGLTICIFAFIMARQFLDSGKEDFDSALLNYAIDLSAQVESGSNKLNPEIKIPKRHLKKSFPFSLGQTFYVLRSLDGTLLFRSHQNDSSEIPYVPALAEQEYDTPRIHSFQMEDTEFRAVNLKLSRPDGEAIILQVATPANFLTDQENRLLMLNLALIPLLIGITSVASYIVAGRAMVPIRTVTSTANSIAASSLSRRVPTVDTGDEVAELSRTFNTLLERLELAFAAQENFVANASHQLNTPLAIIKGELEVLQSKARTPEEIERFHQSLKEELERLIGLVGKMLMISRVESGQEKFIFHPVRIDEILLNTSSRLTTRAREKRITIRFNMSETLDENQMIIMGEKQLLTSLFENLLDNAIKYSPPEGLVGIDITETAEGLSVSISDEGPGIHPDEVRRIFSARFERGSNILMPGTGIGLMIAHQIARYHGASIRHREQWPQGSIFEVLFTRPV